MLNGLMASPAEPLSTHSPNDFASILNVKEFFLFFNYLIVSLVYFQLVEITKII